MTKQLLLACMEAPEQALCAQQSHFAGIGSESLDAEENGALQAQTSNDTIEPLTHTRLDEIGRDVGSFKTTWTSLRKQYPAGKSDFAPLSFTSSDWEAIASAGVIGLSDDLAVDEANSQAATIAAYG
ncbi:hypothetical protein GGF38_005834, partial [Coemansia sp. RSA 25]